MGLSNFKLGQAWMLAPAWNSDHFQVLDLVAGKVPNKDVNGYLNIQGTNKSNPLRNSLKLTFRSDRNLDSDPDLKYWFQVFFFFGPIKLKDIDCTAVQPKFA